MNINLSLFTKYKAILDLLHWASKLYSNHKSVDECSEQLSGSIDKFVEVFIGKYNPELKFDAISGINAITGETVFSIFSEESSKFLGEVTSLCKGDSALLSIRDDISNSIDQCRYLLMMK